MFYASNPLIERLRNEGAFSSENNAFVTALSFKAADLYLKGNRLPSVFAEAANNASNFQYSSFLCLLALSSVIKQSIQTYYPLQNDSKLHSYELFFNCCVLPRSDGQFQNDEPIHLFRCAMTPVDFIFTNKIPDKKDHYVPLMPNCMFRKGIELGGSKAKQPRYS